MCVVIDLDVVCLICLQASKEMRSVFTLDMENSELQIAQKISILSELKIDKNNRSLPSKICNKCLQDLKAAWRFRKNCQAAVTIFQTIVKFDDVQPEVTEELGERIIKVPQGLRVKCLNNSDETSDFQKEDISSMHGVVTPTEELQNEKEETTLYEELAPHDFAENNEDESNEFHELEVAGETNDDDENTFVEYYLTDESTNKSIDSAEQSQDKDKRSATESEDKESKITEFITRVNKPRGRPRRKNACQRDQVEKSTSNLNKESETLARNQSKTENNESEEGNEIEDCNDAAQSQVRQVRTRKRKSSSSDSKPPKICEICGNSYRFQHALNAHMRRHYNDKPFPCEFCDKAFVSNVELRRHMRVHTGQKPYACQYCERRFSDFGSRIKHERTHTGERPYHCVTCGKSFAYPHVLSVHLRTHTGEKRFRCDYCSRGFTKKAYLLTHIGQYHSEQNNFQVVIEDTTDNSQTDPIKSETFEECIFTTEYVNYEGVEDVEYHDNGNQHADKITVQSKVGGDECEGNEEDIHEIVEVHPDEYTIRVR